jgi:hypothetical protein
LNRKLTLCILVLCILFLAATSVWSTTFTTERFALTGSGSFMATSPVFSGQIIAGTLSPGTFWIKFDATGWPADNPSTPENERMDYVLSHYFAYDDTEGAECWDGYFPPTGSAEPMPTWRFYTTAGDTLGGSCTQITITIHDLNANGIIEDSEYESKVIAGNIVAYINYGGGCFQNFCGQGSFSGTLNVVNSMTLEEELYVPSETSASGRLSLRDSGCTVGVESGSWGQIKSIYR